MGDVFVRARPPSHWPFLGTVKHKTVTTVCCGTRPRGNDGPWQAARNPDPGSLGRRALNWSSRLSAQQDSVETDRSLQSIETPQHVKCYGCGVELQTEDGSSLGYIASQKLQTKLQHKQRDQLLCERCVQLTHGKMIPAVEDHRRLNQVDSLKNLLTPEELKDQLKGVRNKKVLVVLLVDLLDLPGSFLSTIRPLIGMNPVVLIGTKLDLLPSQSRLRDVQDWLRDYAVIKKLNVLHVHLVSNRKKTGLLAAPQLPHNVILGLSRASSAILRTRNGRDIYVMGLANVGKSAFVRAFLNELRTLGSSNFTIDAMSKGRFLPVESTMPGTTLGIIKLRALKKKGAVYDTPGVHLFHRLTHLLPPETLRGLLPTRPLSPYVPPSPYDICKQRLQRAALKSFKEGSPKEQVVEEIMAEPTQVSGSYFWGGLMRIDILEAPLSFGLVFFGASVMKVHAFPLLTPGIEPDLQTEQHINKAVLQGAMSHHIVTTRYLDAAEELMENTSPELDDLNYDPYEDLSRLTDAPPEQPPLDLSPHEEPPVEVDVPKAFFGRESALENGLVVAKSFEIECLGFDEALGDISVSGFPGWVSLMVPPLTKGRDRGWLKGRIWVPKGVEVFLRPPIPVDNPLNM